MRRDISYIRALAIVLIFYGGALFFDYLEGGAIFRVGREEIGADMLGWPMLLAVWWMLLVHVPIPAYFWFKGIPLNPYFDNETVFKGIFAIWYGFGAVVGFAAVIAGARYGWLMVAAIIVCIVFAGRGVRLRALAEYGSVCASFFVFYKASGEVPPKMWLPAYLGIGLIQCACLALLQLVFAETFAGHEPAESAAIQAADSSPEKPGNP